MNISLDRLKHAYLRITYVIISHVELSVKPSAVPDNQLPEQLDTKQKYPEFPAKMSRKIFKTLPIQIKQYCYFLYLFKVSSLFVVYIIC